MLSLLTLVMGLAPILAPLLGGVLLQLGGWRANFWARALFGVAVGLATLFRLEESRSEATALQARSESPLAALGALLKDKRLVGYALAGGLNGATLFTWISASPGLLIGVWGIPASIFGWVFGLNAAGVIGAGQINRQLLLRYTPEQVLKAASLAGVAASALLLLAAFTGWGGMWSVLPLIFLVLSSYGFMAGNTMAGALNVDPRRAGSISALMGSASFAAGALASALTGALGDGSARPVAVTLFLAMTGSALALRTLALKGTARV